MINQRIRVHYLLATILLVTILVVFAVCAFCPFVAEATVVATDNKELIEQGFVTYKGNSQYNGAKIASHLGADEFANFEVVDNGGMA